LTANSPLAPLHVKAVERVEALPSSQVNTPIRPRLVILRAG
jgi:hypothetical protein